MDRIRSVVVTGATSGLGRAAAAILAATPGWRVVLGVRDPDRGTAVARELGPAAAVADLDLASLASVRAAADRMARESSPVDALVLDAGAQTTRADRVSADGLELTLAVNHLAHFLLTERLRPALTPDARIVVVSSRTHRGTLRRSGPFPAPRWQDPRLLARPRVESGQRAYATSKLANVYFAYEAARRYPGMAVAAFDPGLMPATGLARSYPAPARAAYTALAPVLTRLRPFAQDPGTAARRLADLVTGPEGTSGYVERGRLAPSSPESYDADRARELWEVSSELVA